MGDAPGCGSRAGCVPTRVITVDEIAALGEALIRQRSTWALFEMRAVLRSEGTTEEHAQRLRVVNDELAAREALR